METIETSWQRSNEMLLGVSFGTYLRRHWDVPRKVVAMSPRRLIAEWEINLQLKWSRKCFLVAGTAANQEFKISDTKLYLPVVASKS